MKRIGNIKRRIATSVTAALLAIGALVLVAPAANAWPWHPTVHVAGNVSCSQWMASPQEIWINAVGQSRRAGFNAWGNYGVDIYNVPGGNSVAVADIRCAGPLGSYWARRIFTISRPGVGIQQNVNFRA